jgi:histidinol-phosphate aminotransferase
MAFASEEIIRILNRIKPPYNISGLTQDTVLAAIQNKEKVDQMIKEILEERNFLQSELAKLPFVQKIHPSHANFLLIKIPNATQVYNDLIAEKVIVRNRAKVLLCTDCLRITVGTRAENEALLGALKKVCLD